MIYIKIPITIEHPKYRIAKKGSEASLCIYLLDIYKDFGFQSDRPAVVICPGGGYNWLSEREAEPIATQFLAKGFHAIVLRYSVTPSEYPAAFLELAYSITYLRQNAKQYHIDAKAIVVTGFSAGGHLAACLGTMWRDSLLSDVFGKEFLWKPNGMILCYPVISSGEFGHQESFQNLFGQQDWKKKKAEVSLECKITSDTVPTFIWHTATDLLVPVENSLLFAMGLKKYKVLFEMHLYQEGNHGLSLCNDLTASANTPNNVDVETWFDLAVRWIKRNYVTLN